MSITESGLQLIRGFEGFVPVSYQDIRGKWTIGYGSTMWQDGTRVIKGQRISRQAADDLLNWAVVNQGHSILALTRGVDINQRQFEALQSFTYQEGIGNLTTSTLLKKINSGASEAEIRYQFSRWNKGHVNGKLVVVDSFTTRRQKEADYYFS